MPHCLDICPTWISLNIMDWCMGLRRWFSADKYGIQSGFQYNNSPTRSLRGPLYGTSVVAMLKTSMESRAYRVSLDVLVYHQVPSALYRATLSQVVLHMIYPNGDLSYDQKVFTCHAHCIGTCTIQV